MDDTKWMNVEPSPDNLPLAIKIRDNKLYLKYPFNLERNTKIKTIGMTFRKNMGWHASITKLFLRDFIKLFPDSINALESLNSLPKQAPVSILPVNGYQPSDYLMPHQERASRLALEKSRFGFFHETGTGKTPIGIELVKQKQLKTLVVCPLSIIETAWMEDLKKFAPEIHKTSCNLWALLDKKKTKRGLVQLQLAMKTKQLFLINFEAFWRNLGMLKSLDVGMLLIDESSMIKSHKSTVTKELIHFADNIDYCYLFSGTPAPNSEMEYWAQIRIIDPMLFGRSFYSFRNKFFYSTGYGNFIWIMKKEERTTFLDMLSKVSEVVEKIDVLHDLPEPTFNVRKIHLSPKEQKAYDEMEKHMILELEGQEVVAVNAISKMMKLREGSSGFYITEELLEELDDDGMFKIKKSIVRVGDSKLKELKSLLAEIGNHQVIIWIHFHEEGHQVCNYLDSINATFGRVDGTISRQTDKIQSIYDFKEGKLQYLVAHPKSLAHGQTLVNCMYSIYFSLSHSYELYKQSKDRIHRKGQKDVCTYYFFVAHNSVDVPILRALKNKGKVVNNVFQYLKSKKGGDNGQNEL